jgi:hypothetical protein
MIETKSRSCEGWFPNRQLSKLLLWNHPPSPDVGSRFAIPLPSLLRRAICSPDPVVDLFESISN